MSEGALVTAAEIARLANVGRAAVSNWRRRHPDFPEPVVGSGANPAYRLTEVERWLRRQGKLSDRRPVDVLWRVVDPGGDETELMNRVADIAAHLRDPERADPGDRVREVLGDLVDEPADELVESLCTRLFDRQQRQHLVTPTELARLMVELAAPLTGTVFDPACGPGNLLRVAAERGAERVLGQEISESLARLAQARLALTTAVNIADGDALRADAFSDLRADAVVCDPPFGYRDWGHDELGIDPRWEYGFPVKGEPELAWLQHCLAHVKPGGEVVLALPAAVAQRRAGRAIRRALLQRSAIRAVVALPAGVLMSTGIPIHLWVLRNPNGNDPGRVLLVDAGQHQPSRRGQVNWHALSDDVLAAWREFHDSGTAREIPGRQRAMEPIELLDEDVDLTPSRHLPQPVVELDVATLETTRQQLVRTLGELGSLLPEVREAKPVARPSTTIGDLARAGALELRQSVGRLELDEDGDGPVVLTGRDVATGSEPTGRLADARDEPVHLRPGDLVVPLLAAGDGRPTARVIDSDDIETGGLVLGPNLQLIRVDDTRLDVHFLAGHIRAGSSARAGSTTASGVHRIDVRRIEVPVADIAEQRRLGAVFRKLATFEVSVGQAAERGIRFVCEIADGLAGGVLDAEPKHQAEGPGGNS
jgi:SAM-dependent methyltransferase